MIIERIQDKVGEPKLIHNCHRGNCKRRAKFTIKDDEGKKIEQICMYHVKKICYQNKLKMIN